MSETTDAPDQGSKNVYFTLELEYKLSKSRSISSSSLVSATTTPDGYQDVQVVKTLLEGPGVSRFFLFPQMAAEPPTNDQKKHAILPLLWRVSDRGEILSTDGEPVDLDVWRWGCFPVWWAAPE